VARAALLAPLLLLAGAERENVGGQAVLEGVMMRGPKRWSVDVRLPDGEIVSKVTESEPLARRFRILGVPFVRGVATLFESLAVGARALNYSAAVLEAASRTEAPQAGGGPAQRPGPGPSLTEAPAAAAAGGEARLASGPKEAEAPSTAPSQSEKPAGAPPRGGNGKAPPEALLGATASPPQPPAAGAAGAKAAGPAAGPLAGGPAKAPPLADQPPPESLGALPLALTLALSFLLAAFLFAAAPHWIAIAAGGRFGFSEKDLAFHIADGAIKFAFFLLYVWGVGKIPEIRRVYSYHGAEHRAIWAWEAGLPLEPLYARHFPLRHPRCGTAFIFLLLALSIILFSIVFPLLFTFEGDSALKRTALGVLLKIALTIPLAGASYEISRRAGKPKSSVIWRIIIFPGLLIQGLTTRETDDSQLEVALRALSEAVTGEPPKTEPLAEEALMAEA
jgi:uncharacterized protein YqhQ